MKKALPFQHIFIITDFRASHHNALNYAIRLSKINQAQLSIIHDEQTPLLHEEAATSKLQALASTEVVSNSPDFRSYIDQLKTEYPLEMLQTIDLEYLLKEVSYIDQIRALTQMRSFSLLVLPTKSENAILELFKDSDTDTLLEKMPCPILAIPEKATYQTIKNIYYATDLKGEESMVAIKKLRAITAAIEAELHFVHVITETTRSYEKKANAFREKAATILETTEINWTELEETNILEALLNFSKKPTVNLLAVVKRPKSTFNKLITKQIPNYLAKEAKVPVLLL